MLCKRTSKVSVFWDAAFFNLEDIDVSEVLTVSIISVMCKPKLHVNIAN